MADKPPVVYLDNNATTELSQDVAGVVMDLVLHNVYGNPSSSHEMGSKIKVLLQAARYSVAQSIGCSTEEVVFTSGGTEANNLALRGVYHPPGDLIISAGEHSSVYKTAHDIAGDGHVRLIPYTEDGSLDLEWAERLITADTSLVSVMLANNETGALFDIREIVRLAHKRGALVHCDAVQAYGKVPIDVRDFGVDLLTISGHKAHALPGIGALYVRKELIIRPTITGGGQEHFLRAGTENYVGAASLGTVANEITRRNGNMESGLRDAFEAGIKKRIPDVVIHAEDVPRVPNTSNVSFKGVHALAMLTALSEMGIYASAGSACSSGSSKPSRTLTSMGVSEKDALSAVRFSFSSMSKIMDVALAIEACVKCVETLRQGAELGAK